MATRKLFVEAFHLFGFSLIKIQRDTLRKMEKIKKEKIKKEKIKREMECYNGSNGKAAIIRSIFSIC